MSSDFQTICTKYALSAEMIQKITGASDRTARAWLSGEKHVPEPALRLLLVVLGEVSPENYRP